MENSNLFVLEYKKRDVTVDLRCIMAISRPKERDKYFCVYFDSGVVWRVPADAYRGLSNAWKEQA